MIQVTESREDDTTNNSSPQDTLEQWGTWSGNKHYSLDVVQHPLRARMCGFGDKDRRPLAPAAVAKMVVSREDESTVDVDEVDCSFFIVTVDLFSSDGKQQTNLVLHPTAADRFAPSQPTAKSTKKSSGDAAPLPRSSGPSGSQTPAGHTSPPPGSQYRPADQGGPSNSGNSHPAYPSHGSYAPGQAPPDPTAYSQATPYGPSQPTTWGYPPPPPPPVDRNMGFPPPVLPSIHTFGRTSSSGSTTNWPPESTAPEAYRWSAGESGYPPPENNYPNDDSNVDPSLRTPSTSTSEARDGKAPWSQPNAYGQPSTATSNADGADSYNQAGFNPPAYAPYPQGVPSSLASAPGAPVIQPRQSYTRTLVGPLSANATRLLDEHRKAGIFFLFQDLSVRTEGTFRLRMRLMNVGFSPAPEMGANRVHNDISPVLAQTFTEPFTVYSAKRFPGVPDTTALSIALGNQGQKLPLRNRHGSSNKRRRRGESGSEDESE
ncbi:velvet factor [Crepidotus variabilis]|uniref:Velvet factor n=1 Tax=Crepidotus variabilis TaxID=179855 RepID=A0A9P6ETR6_9AGAR|nr:velvet factor [Crepidotus variabilis]